MSNLSVVQKRTKYIRRKERKRYNLKKLNKGSLNRLYIFKSCKHFYASLINIHGDILLHISTLQKGIRNNQNIKSYNLSGIQEVARQMGLAIQKLDNQNFISDTSGYPYVGKVKEFFTIVQGYMNKDAQENITEETK